MGLFQFFLMPLKAAKKNDRGIKYSYSSIINNRALRNKIYLLRPLL